MDHDDRIALTLVEVVVAQASQVEVTPRMGQAKFVKAARSFVVLHLQSIQADLYRMGC